MLKVNKPNLLIVNGAQFGYSSGHYYYCKYLSTAFSIRYICFDRGLERVKLNGIEVTYVSFSGSTIKRNARFLKQCINYCSNLKPDILFVTYFNLCFLLAIFCKSGKAVLDIRTGSLKKNRLIRRFENFIILLQTYLYDKIVILSPNLQRKLAIQGRNSIVIPLGSEIFYTGDHHFNSLKLLYVGALDNRNITETIEGVSLFLKASPENAKDFRYTIIGFGSDHEVRKLTNSISEMDLTHVVQFLGRKTHDEMSQYFKETNIGIVYIPQKKWYDFQPGTKLYEYMLSGMPVIATNTYENRIVVNGENGVLINDTAEDFSKGLEEVMNKSPFYNSSIIRQFVIDNTWENIVLNKLQPFLFGLVK
jgi:glycosyltransferase involved in cell wall biosynthesis